MSNIFPQAGSVAFEDNFIGRVQEIKKATFLLSNSQSILFVAPRRYGKTSLMFKVKDELEKNNIVVIHIDLMNLYSLRQLASTIIEQTYNSIGITKVIKNISNLTTTFLTDTINYLASIKLTMADIEFESTQKLITDKSIDDIKLFEYALDLPQKIAKLTNKKIVFMYDELGEIKHYTKYNELLKKMRSYFQLQKNITYMFAGSQYSLMNEIFQNSNSPFFKFAQKIDVKPMKYEEFIEYFEKLFSQYDIKVYENFVKDIHKLSSGIPYYIMSIAKTVLTNSIIGDQKTIYKTTLFKSALEVYNDEIYSFMQELSKIKGNKHDLTILQSIAKDENVYTELKGVVDSANISKKINTLSKDGIIIRDKDKVYIPDPFLRRYITKEI
jgi:hypothetical protein